MAHDDPRERLNAIAFPLDEERCGEYHTAGIKAELFSAFCGPEGLKWSHASSPNAQHPRSLLLGGYRMPSLILKIRRLAAAFAASWSKNNDVRRLWRQSRRNMHSVLLLPVPYLRFYAVRVGGYMGSCRGLRLPLSPSPMHPFTRQPTLDSVRSWWSDRNPPGPNINLHAAAKPLMRVMYHRDALAFIRNTRGTPLSKEAAEIYSSYLSYGVPLFKYVSSETKTAILRELCDRVESANDADIVVHSPVLYLVDGLLQLPETEIRVATCRLVTCLTSHKSTATAVVGVNPCLRLVTLLRDRNPQVIASAVQVLGRIATSLNGAQAVVDANALNSLVELLKSSQTPKVVADAEEVLHQTWAVGHCAAWHVRGLLQLEWHQRTSKKVLSESTVNETTSTAQRVLWDGTARSTAWSRRD
ncbi:hypothetical protein FB451DRAFT_1172350 [Mycena latifolia]|nr:hypothetical protein FB451DRAFT_1172350 [Mycena latifolia]